ncbi:hypothetical protein Tco_0093395 [Tanacetum coccineum]
MAKKEEPCVKNATQEIQASHKGHLSSSNGLNCRGCRSVGMYLALPYAFGRYNSELNDDVMTLSEALAKINAKEELVKQHIKVAEEAISCIYPF